MSNRPADDGEIRRTVYPLPPRVVVVRTYRDGRVERVWLPADEAVLDLWLNPENGLEIASARIEWGRELDCWSYSGHFPPSGWMQPDDDEPLVGRL